MNTLLIILLIYIFSVFGSWCYYQYIPDDDNINNPKLSYFDSTDEFVKFAFTMSIIPIINTFLTITIILVLLLQGLYEFFKFIFNKLNIKVSYLKLAKKFFLLK